MKMRLRLVAAMILAASLGLPLLSVPEGLERAPRSYRWAIAEASGDWLGVFVVLAAFLWPFATLALHRTSLPRGFTTIVEPLSAILSVWLILGVLSFSLEIRQVFVIFFLPVSGRAEIGTWAAILGNALYLTAWAWDLAGRPRPGAYRLAT